MARRTAVTRERDSLGRPLPPGVAGTPGIPDRDRTDNAAVWSEALHYLERGLPFHAHEVFEERWRNCPADERPAWRALAQWGAAETHAARGSAAGATSLAARALEGLDSLDCTPPPIDAQLVRERCTALIIASEGDTIR